MILSILCGAFVVWVLVNLFRVRRVTREFVSGRVSILIPARHEEVTLPACLLSAVFTSAAEILVYNDSSTDGTANVVSSSMARYDRIRLIEGGPLPVGWVGKAYACQQLAEAANSEWLLFLDAGARISSQGLERLLAEAQQRKLTCVSCRAEVERPSFAQQVILPALDFIGFGLAPGLLAAGSCTLVHKATYELLGGHQAFASEVGADLALAREWGRRGERGSHFDGLGVLKSGRSEGFGDLWATFRRHFYLSFPGRAAFVGFMALASFFLLLPWWPMLLAVVVLRVGYAVRLRQPLWSALLHPFAMLFLLTAAVASFGDAHSSRGVEWKGRRYLIR